LQVSSVSKIGLRQVAWEICLEREGLYVNSSIPFLIFKYSEQKLLQLTE